MSLKDVTFGEFIDAVCSEFREETAIIGAVHGGEGISRVNWSYGALWAKLASLQHELSARGVRPGDRVALLLSSFPEWIVYLFAVTRMGGTVVPVNPRFGSWEIGYVLEHCEANVLVGMGQYLGRHYEDLIRTVVGSDWSPERGSSRLPALKLIFGVGGRPHRAAVDTSELLERGRMRLEELGEPPRSPDGNAVAVIFYTSGTTGFPKAVPLSHRNIVPHSVHCGRHLGIHPGERVLSLYPFFGAAGGANKIVSTFGSGGCLVFQDSYRAADAFELLETENCTVLHAVDVQIRDLIEIAQVKKAKRPRAGRRGTIAFMTGLDSELAGRMGEFLGINRFIHPYGMTETNPMILRNNFEDEFETTLRPGGQTAPGVSVRIVVPGSLQDQEVDTPGEIVVSGETVTSGYLRDHEANAKAFAGGWFRTGDLGVRTPEGLIFYVGRLGDLLKVGGFNVAPQEVERFLRTHEVVYDVAVTSAPDRRLGQVVVAFVKLLKGHIANEQVIQEYCRSRIANFKIPRRVYFIERLPYHSAAHGAKLRRDVLKRWARLRAHRA